MDEILDTPGLTCRDVAAASRILLSASRVSLESVKTAIKAHDHEKLTELVDDLENREKVEDEERAAARGPFA